MKLTEKDIEQLMGLWEGSLSNNERLELEKRMETDAVFRQDARQFQLLNEGLEVIKQRQMRHRFQDLDATLPDIKTPPPYNWLMIGLVALGLALAALAVWYFAIREEKPKVKPIYAAYFEPYPALGITMGNDDKTVRLEALKTYAKKDYEKAIPLLDKAFSIEKDSLLLFYKGISHIGNSTSAQAIPILESLKTATFLSVDTVDWFLALAYLETNQKDKAVILLEKVKNTEGGKYHAKAAELLEKI